MHLFLEQLSGEVIQLRQQLSSQQKSSDTNKVIDKLEKDLQAKKTEIAALKDKVSVILVYLTWLRRNMEQNFRNNKQIDLDSTYPRCKQKF